MVRPQLPGIAEGIPGGVLVVAAGRGIDRLDPDVVIVRKVGDRWLVEDLQVAYVS